MHQLLLHMHFLHMYPRPCLHPHQHLHHHPCMQHQSMGTGCPVLRLLLCTGAVGLGVGVCLHEGMAAGTHEGKSEVVGCPVLMLLLCMRAVDLWGAYLGVVRKAGGVCLQMEGV